MAAIAPGGASVAFATEDGHLEVRRWGDGAPLGIDNGMLGASAIAYSADGALFAASTPQGLKVWRLSDGTLLSQVPELANQNAIGLSNDGSVVAGGSPLTVHSAAGVRRVGGNLGGNVGLAVSPDGSLVAGTFSQSTGSVGFPYAYTNAVWRNSDGQLLWSSSAGNAPLAPMPTTLNVFFSRDGTLIAFGGYSYAALGRVMRPSDGTIVSQLGSAALFAFTDDGMGVIGQGSQSSRYGIYRVSDGMEARTFSVSAPLSDSRILAAGFSSGTTVLAAVELIPSRNHQLFVDGALARDITRVGTQALSLMAMSSDGKRVLTVDLDGGRVWDTATSQVVQTIPGASAAAFAPDGRLATCGSGSCTVRSAPGSPGFGLSVEAAAIAFSRDGTLIATGNRDNTATLWSGVDGAMLRSLWNLTSGHTMQVTGVAFSPDGTRIATVSRDKTIKLWTVADGSVVRTISTGVDEATTVSFSPDGGWVLGGPRGIWEVTSGAAVPSPENARSGVFSPSSPTLFTGGTAITRFGLPDFTDLGQVPGSAVRGGVRSLVITANGGMLASRGNSAVVRLWCSP